MEATQVNHPVNDNGFWVFGYGSLMWKPGFDVAEARMARLDGYRRAFALTSVHYRGTPEFPGQPLYRHGVADRRRRGRRGAPLPGRARAGVAGLFRGQAQDHPAVPRNRFRAGSERNRGALEEQAAIIGKACGPTGSNCDYLFNTVSHLRELGVEDPELFALEQMVRERIG
jgi:cation transport protein ChaC